MASEAEHAASGRRLNDLLACVQLARGFSLITVGQYSDAYDALRRLFDPADPAFDLAERYRGVMFLAEAALHAGRADQARPVIAALGAETAVTPSATLAGHLSYARAVLADGDHAEEEFTKALRADLIRWPWLRARLELAYGSWLRRQRRVAESRIPLRSALTTLRPHRCWQLGPAGPRGTAGQRRAPHAGIAGCGNNGGVVGAGGPVCPGTADRPARRGGPEQSGNRRAALPVTPHRGLPSVPDLPQAQHHLPGAARRTARAGIARPSHPVSRVTEAPARTRRTSWL
jgi:hypothetical protein